MTSSEPSIRAFAGVDGGATKTRARVITSDGGLIGEGIAGPGSLTLSPDSAAANCRSALMNALGGSGIELAVCRVACGMAGHRHPERREVFEDLLSDLGELEVISDGYAALLGAHQGAPGGVVITGTGSVALRLDEYARVRQFGGFGPVCGDEGGGNWLGRATVRASLRAADDTAEGDGCPPALASAIIDHMGGDHVAILDWISKADATGFAKLVPLIVRHDAEGDPLARRLLDEAADEIRRLIRLVRGKGELPVSIVGGLAELLKVRLPDEVRLGLKAHEGDAMDGALLRARWLAPAERYH
jgi:glucosamine kinase